MVWQLLSIKLQQNKGCISLACRFWVCQLWYLMIFFSVFFLSASGPGLEFGPKWRLKGEEFSPGILNTANWLALSGIAKKTWTDASCAQWKMPFFLMTYRYKFLNVSHWTSLFKTCSNWISGWCGGFCLYSSFNLK